MKIGMYNDDEILEHLTEGEGRGFLGRSMYDAIKETFENKNKEIERLQNIIEEAREYVEEHEEFVPSNKLFEDKELKLSEIELNELLKILGKENKDDI